MIARIFTTFLLFSLSAGAADRAPLLVSDVDDTVKIADVPHKGPAIVNGLFGEGIFGGMAPLYTVMAKEPDSLIFLSGGPTLLYGHAKDELTDVDFPPFQLILRDVFKKGNSVPVHKRARLEELLAANPDRTFILVGDDGQADPETLSGFADAHPGKVLAVYIHRILARKVPASVTTYNTAFELALHEFAAGRITEADAAEVGHAVLATKAKRIFPDFVECPRTIAYPTSSEIEASSELKALIVENQTQWSSLCAGR
jgi:phosphatidate phosphatase APP1